MKHSVRFGLIGLMSCLILTACSRGLLYLSPNVVGYVYNDQTKQPIRNQGSILIPVVSVSDSASTDQTGKFFLAETVVKKSYWTNRRVYMTPGSKNLEFIIRGYELKRIDLRQYGNLPYITSGETMGTIDVGKIYLTPVTSPSTQPSEQAK